MSTSDAFIVTGAGSGIGHAIAARLIARGHRVFGLGRDSAKLARAGASFGDDRFGFAAVDLAHADGVGVAVTAARRWIGASALRGLVNNAGVFRRADFNDTDDQAWTWYFTNNLMSAVRLSRALHPDLKGAGGASVLNMSSTLGLRPIAGTVAYSAFKAAMNSLTAGLALEWAADGIRVNAICPGIVDTPIQDFNRHGDAHARAAAAKLTPLGRVGQPADVAAAATFLLSEDSGWTTGATLTVDGGVTL